MICSSSQLTEAYAISALLTIESRNLSGQRLVAVAGKHPIGKPQPLDQGTDDLQQQPAD